MPVGNPTGPGIHDLPNKIWQPIWQKIRRTRTPTTAAQVHPGEVSLGRQILVQEGQLELQITQMSSTQEQKEDRPHLPGRARHRPAPRVPCRPGGPAPDLVPVTGGTA